MGEHKYEPLQARIDLPAEIQGLVSPEQLVVNETMLLQSAPEVDPAALEIARQKLLSTYLIHTTETTQGFQWGLSPHRHVARIEKRGEAYGRVGTTFRFDKSLGLDTCTFFNWPLVTSENDYGSQRVLVDADILLEPNCFVTPRDVLSSVRANEDEFGEELDMSDDEFEERADIYEALVAMGYDGVIEGIENPKMIEPYDSDIPLETRREAAEHFIKQLQNVYLKKIVSGKTWLEYMARLLAADPSAELPKCEVKYKGKVSASKIMGIIDVQEYKNDYVPHVERVLKGE